MTRIGVISDTHGMLRDSAVAALDGSDHILHAGDIDSIDVLRALQAIAPVTAVRGNMDRGSWASHLRHEESEIIDGIRFLLRHNPFEVMDHPERAGYQVVVTGHTHRRRKATQHGVLYLNPGSAGPQRYREAPALAILTINGDNLDVETVEL